ncbi:MAG: glycoside hydrolase [Bacteroidetes bacterium]|nr:glycoside hydrolase [Bacteroidota bacterium]
MRPTNLKKLFAVLLFCFTAVTLFSQENKIRVLSYYAGPADALDNFDANQMTHIIFCFGRLNGNKFGIRGARDTAVIQKMMSLKSKNPDLKVLISLGGWGGCKTCSDVFATKVGRQEFVQSIKEIYDYFKVDGLDLDWEYPGISGFPGHKFMPEDKKNFTKLVKELRKLGYEKELSFAAGASQRFLDSAAQWKQVMKMVDYVNLMTYDMSGPGSKTAMHHTALFSSPEQPRSADWMVKSLIDMGVPAGKIVVGGAFMERSLKMWKEQTTVLVSLQNSRQQLVTGICRQLCLLTAAGFIIGMKKPVHLSFTMNRKSSSSPMMIKLRLQPKPNMSLTTNWVV